MPFSPRYDFITPFADEAMRLLRETWANPTMLAEELMPILRSPIPQKSGPITINLNGGQEDFVRLRNQYGDEIAAINFGGNLVRRTPATPRETPTIIWEDPSSILSGTALSSTQLNAVAVDAVSGHELDGTYEYDPASGTVLAVGENHPLSVVFTPTNSTSYKRARKTVHIDVNGGAVQTYIFLVNEPSDLNGLSSLESQGLDSSVFEAYDNPVFGEGSPVAGTFDFDPPLSTIPEPPLVTITATFTPDDLGAFLPAEDEFEIVILSIPTHIVQVSGAPDFNNNSSMAAQGWSGDDYEGRDPDENPVAGMFSFDPPLSTTPSEPDITLTVTFTPDSAAYDEAVQEFGPYPVED